jgi:hypothetical protein
LSLDATDVSSNIEAQPNDSSTTAPLDAMDTPPAVTSATEDTAPDTSTNRRSVCRDQSYQSSPSKYFDVDTTLERQSRKGRGTRSVKFHEEFGYETLLTELAVPGEVLAYAAMVVEPTEISAMGATADPDTMYFHQAMRQPDADDFLAAAHKEFQNLLDRNIVEIIPAHLVPTGMKIFSAVWAMKRKRRLRAREVYKYKARLNLDGSQMLPGNEYDLTYAPVASWESVRILLALALHCNWKTKQLDYVLAFPQAPVERDCYMQIPKGIVINAPGEWVLQVKRNIYGQKQAGQVWNSFLVKKLTGPDIGFVQSQYDECVFYHGKAIYVLYTDDSILAGPDEEELNTIVSRIKAVGLDITEEGDLEDFLGINIDRLDDRAYHLSQSQLID